MNDYKQDLSSVLLSYYIRYDTLFELHKQMIETTDTQYVDIYIDLYDMLKSLYTTELYANKSFAVVAGIINLCAHYRAFYKTRYRMWARIFLVYGTESNSNHRQFMTTFDYRVDPTTYRYNEINEVIKSQLELVKILAAYIDDVYFVERSSDFSMFTLEKIYECRRIAPGRSSIIITKNKYMYQIPGLFLNQPVYLLRPTKYKGVDNSIIVRSNTAITSYYKELTGDKLIAKLVKINPELLSLIFTIHGCKHVNIAPLTNISRTINFIYDAIENNRIINAHQSDTDYLYKSLKIGDLIDGATFEYRFKSLDILYQFMIYSNSIEAKDNTWFINLRDPDTVRNINNKYFANNPLDLNNL